MNSLVWLIPLAPLFASIICAIMAVLGQGKTIAHLPVWLGLGVSSCVSLFFLFNLNPVDPTVIIQGYQWLEVGRVNIHVDLRLDSVSLVQISVVTCISTLVAIYSAGYMHGDPGYPRFFAVFAGFVFCMSMLVLSNNLLILYAFWEGVGLCSYLLIGYWYQKPSAAQAAFKAFLVNRVADCGFLIGILTLGYAVSLIQPEQSPVVELFNFDVIYRAVPQLSTEQPLLLTFIGFMLLIGAIGKSAQFPFHVWLPDAMEGPTPVSALIHAATMVTAGVYLMARMSPLLTCTPAVLMVAGWLGTITALLAAVIALYQHDLKRVLAYSTVSQLGYMFIAIGAGAEQGVMIFGVVAAMFHLLTHAFFKALLFLVAGNVMHSMGDVIDMRKFGGLRKVLPQSHILFFIGAAALAGLPPLAGFWSKDGILALLASHISNESHSYGFVSWFGIGLLTALLTSIYTFRAFFRVFYGPEHFPPEAGEHPHEATPVMLFPLWILAIGSIVVGLLLGPTGILQKYLSEHFVLTHSAAHGHEETWLLMLSSLIGFVGMLIAWWTTQAQSSIVDSSTKLAPATGFARLAENRFYLDEIYDYLLVRPVLLLGYIVHLWDLLIMNGLWQLVTSIPTGIALIFRQQQNGMLQNYAWGMAAGVILLLMIVWVR